MQESAKNTPARKSLADTAVDIKYLYRGVAAKKKASEKQDHRPSAIRPPWIMFPTKPDENFNRKFNLFFKIQNYAK